MFDRYIHYEYQLAQVQLVLFMFGMGAALTPRDFIPVFRQPRDLCLGLSIQLVLMSFVAVLFNYLVGFEAGMAVGIVLIAALPGGTLSNVFTFLSRGNTALSIALSGSAALLSILTIPVVLKFLAAEYVPEGFQMPVWGIIREILLCLMLPLTAGMFLVRIWPERKKAVSQCSFYLGFFFVLVMVVGSLGSGRVRPLEHSFLTFLAIIFFCVLMQQLSMLPHRIIGWPVENCVAIGLEVTTRNIYLGLLLAALLFPAGQSVSPVGDDVLFVLLTYAAIMLFVALPLALRIRRKLRAKIPAFAASTDSTATADPQEDALVT